MTKKSLSFLLVATTLTIAAAQTSCTSQPRQDTESLKREAVLGNIHQRKSVRDYTTQPVEDEKTTALLEAAMAAPSGKDTRPWHFVVINDRARLDSMAAELGNAKMLAKAPMAIVICGDSTVSSYWYLDCSPGRIFCWRRKRWDWERCGRRPFPTRTAWRWCAATSIYRRTFCPSA